MPKGIGYGKKQTGKKRKGTQKTTSKMKGSASSKGKKSDKKRR
jgi:hypothetical protein